MHAHQLSPTLPLHSTSSAYSRRCAHAVLFMAIDRVAARQMNQRRTPHKSAQEAQEKEDEEARAEWAAEGRPVPPRGGRLTLTSLARPSWTALPSSSESIHKKLSTDPGWRGITVIFPTAQYPRGRA